MMYGWSPQSTGIFVHLNRRWDVQTIWKCMQNRSKWHVPWMRMFCHCFPFIVFTVPKDQRGEVGTSFQIVSSASEPVISSQTETQRFERLDWFPLVIPVGVSSNKSKKGVHPKSIGTVCFIPGQTHLATRVPSFTSRSSEILLWCLFNIATWEKKVWLQRSDKSDPMMWNCVMEIPGHRCWTSHGFTCAVRSKDLTSNAWNSCPSMSVEFRELKLAGRFGALGAKKCVDMVWFHPIHLHGEPGLFSQGLEEPEDGAGSDPNSDRGRCLNLMRSHVWLALRFKCPA